MDLNLHNMFSLWDQDNSDYTLEAALLLNIFTESVSNDNEVKSKYAKYEIKI